RQFGSWAKALVVAGVTKKPRTKKLYRGRPSLLNALSDALERDALKNMPQALKLEAVHYFGSLEKAISTLKKQRKRLPGWNRRKIMTMLSRIAPVQRKPVLRESTTWCSGFGKRRRSPFWQLGQGFKCRRDRPKFVFCASQVSQTEMRLVRLDAA